MNCIKKIKFYLMMFMLLIHVLVMAQESVNVSDIILKNIHLKEINISELTDSKTTVFIFLSPECPMCIKYSLPIRNLTSQFQKDAVSIILVFPCKHYSVEQIQLFLNEHNLNNEVLLDEQLVLTQKLNAEITPQVFLIKDSKIFYSGKIDNWYQKLGKKRKQATVHYLSDAINALRKGEEISVKSTEAIGCLIN